MMSWLKDNVTEPVMSSMAGIFAPRNSLSITNSKGLLNAPGENNCFLNSAVQVLWHLDVFRRSFRQFSGHACMGNSCIFCALKVIFTQFQYSDETALPPDALRKALAETFEDQQRFQLGFMDDAAECFESILLRIHYHVANEVKEDMCNAKHCISHQKFAMTVVEQCMCGCGATSEPLPFTQMVHYVSVTAMIAQGNEMLEKTKKPYPEMFGQLLKNAGGVGDLRNCPSNCGERVQIRRMLMNSPEIVSLGLVWDTDQPTVEHIMDVINCLGTTIRLVDVFHSVVDDSAAGKVLHLVGVVTYYGKHYSTFFFHTRLKTWIYFDDATVKEIGSKWKDVVEKCRKGHYQPLLLLFADHFGSPVNTETAPTETTMLPGYTHGEGAQRLTKMSPAASPTHQKSKSSSTSGQADYTTHSLGKSDHSSSSHHKDSRARRKSGSDTASVKSQSSQSSRSSRSSSSHGQYVINGPVSPISGKREWENGQTAHPIQPDSRPGQKDGASKKTPLVRKDSAKKGKDRVKADYVRYQRNDSNESKSTPSSPTGSFDNDMFVQQTSARRQPQGAEASTSVPSHVQSSSSAHQYIQGGVDTYGNPSSSQPTYMPVSAAAMQQSSPYNMKGTENIQMIPQIDYRTFQQPETQQNIQLSTVQANQRTGSPYASGPSQDLVQLKPQEDFRQSLLHSPQNTKGLVATSPNRPQDRRALLQRKNSAPNFPTFKQNLSVHSSEPSLGNIAASNSHGDLVYLTQQGHESPQRYGPDTGRSVNENKAHIPQTSQPGAPVDYNQSPVSRSSASANYKVQSSKPQSVYVGDRMDGRTPVPSSDYQPMMYNAQMEEYQRLALHRHGSQKENGLHVGNQAIYSRSSEESSGSFTSVEDQQRVPPPNPNYCYVSAGRQGGDMQGANAAGDWRDSGYRSGDRNSASSTSSLSFESPSIEGSYTMAPQGNNQDNLIEFSLPPQQQQGQGSAAGSSAGQGYLRSQEVKHKSGSDLIDLGQESTAGVGDPCIRLCQEAEQLLLRSCHVEAAGDLASALCLCTTAIARLQTAVNVAGSNPQSLAYAKLKYDTCMMRSRSLHRRLLIRRQHSSPVEEHRTNWNDSLDNVVKSLLGIGMSCICSTNLSPTNSPDSMYTRANNRPTEVPPDLIQLEDQRPSCQNVLQQKVRELYLQKGYGGYSSNIQAQRHAQMAAAARVQQVPRGAAVPAAAAAAPGGAAASVSGAAGNTGAQFTTRSSPSPLTRTRSMEDTRRLSRPKTPEHFYSKEERQRLETTNSNYVVFPMKGQTVRGQRSPAEGAMPPGEGSSSQKDSQGMQYRDPRHRAKLRHLQRRHSHHESMQPRVADDQVAPVRPRSRTPEPSPRAQPREDKRRSKTPTPGEMGQRNRQMPHAQRRSKTPTPGMVEGTRPKTPTRTTEQFYESRRPPQGLPRPRPVVPNGPVTRSNIQTRPPDGIPGHGEHPRPSQRQNVLHAVQVGGNGPSAFTTNVPIYTSGSQRQNEQPIYVSIDHSRGRPAAQAASEQRRGRESRRRDRDYIPSSATHYAVYGATRDQLLQSHMDAERKGLVIVSGRQAGEVQASTARGQLRYGEGQLYGQQLPSRQPEGAEGILGTSADKRISGAGSLRNINKEQGAGSYGSTSKGVPRPEGRHPNELYMKMTASRDGNTAVSPEQQQMMRQHKQQQAAAWEQQQLMAQEQQQLMTQEQQQLMMPEQQRFITQEQQQLMTSEQQRFMTPEQQRLMTPEQQQFMTPEQQRLMTPEQQQFLTQEQQQFLTQEQQQFMTPEQQRLVTQEQQQAITLQQQWAALRQQHLQRLQNRPEVPGGEGGGADQSQLKNLKALQPVCTAGSVWPDPALQQQMRQLYAQQHAKNLIASLKSRQVVLHQRHQELLAYEQIKPPPPTDVPVHEGFGAPLTPPQSTPPVHHPEATAKKPLSEPTNQQPHDDIPTNQRPSIQTAVSAPVQLQVVHSPPANISPQRKIATQPTNRKPQVLMTDIDETPSDATVRQAPSPQRPVSLVKSPQHPPSQKAAHVNSNLPQPLQKQQTSQTKQREAAVQGKKGDEPQSPVKLLAQKFEMRVLEQSNEVQRTALHQQQSRHSYSASENACSSSFQRNAPKYSTMPRKKPTEESSGHDSHEREMMAAQRMSAQVQKTIPKKQVGFSKPGWNTQNAQGRVPGVREPRYDVPPNVDWHEIRYPGTTSVHRQPMKNPLTSELKQLFRARGVDQNANPEPLTNGGMGGASSSSSQHSTPSHESQPPSPHRPTYIRCHLCQKVYVEHPRIYCASCEAYMSRFRPGK
ncbi:uncharacterized protein [Branchiostoma lanceolatum]|uniref:uncharacterized protein isoform X1 n=1 Tax=Branchiostoma lanceolatum TaxID=7740 RepID=UPI00345614EF